MNSNKKLGNSKKSILLIKNTRVTFLQKYRNRQYYSILLNIDCLTYSKVEKDQQTRQLLSII